MILPSVVFKAGIRNSSSCFLSLSAWRRWSVDRLSRIELLSWRAWKLVASWKRNPIVLAWLGKLSTSRSLHVFIGALAINSRTEEMPAASFVDWLILRKNACSSELVAKDSRLNAHWR